MEEPKVVFNDSRKLYDLGVMDGRERAQRIMSTNPDNIDYLQAIGLPQYLAGYQAGINEVIEEYKQLNSNTPKI